jgi:transcriptional regulator with XRE-family HTH domain
VNDRPSEPLLLFLREFLRRKSLNTAEVALRLGIDRTTLRKRLSGEEPLTVDDLILLGKILDIRPDELAGVSIPEESTPRLSLVGAAPLHNTMQDTPAAGEDWAPDPTGNLTWQTLRYGFALGVDMFLIFDAAELKDSGIPQHILKDFQKNLPIDLPARYHRHNKPQFEEEGFSCVLSFDRLYNCFFPWTAFLNIQFKVPKEPPVSRPKAPEPPPIRPGSHLRVVK